MFMRRSFVLGFGVTFLVGTGAVGTLMAGPSPVALKGLANRLFDDGRADRAKQQALAELRGRLSDGVPQQKQRVVAGGFLVDVPLGFHEARQPNAGYFSDLPDLYSTRNAAKSLPRVALKAPVPAKSQPASIPVAKRSGSELSFKTASAERSKIEAQRKRELRDRLIAAKEKGIVPGADMALAYAGAASKLSDAPFEAVLRNVKPVPLPKPSPAVLKMPSVPSDDFKWAKQPLPRTVVTEKEQKCLSEAIYFEARGESRRGQAAVAQVVLNRVKNPSFPDTICGVVYQNDHKRNRCQFSFACDGKKETIGSKKAWHRAEKVAKSVTTGDLWLDDVGSSTHYHADYVNPRWAAKLLKVSNIGKHVFYKTKSGGWW